MTSPTALYADYLQSASLLTSAEDAPTIAAFGEEAVEGSAMTPYVNKADADAEAARHLAFKKFPHVPETVEIFDDVDPAALRGRCWTITSPAPGYTGGALCFVLGGDRDDATGAVNLYVLRRLL